MKPEEIHSYIKEGVLIAGRAGLIITADCTAKLDTPRINFYAARVALSVCD